MMDHHEIEAIRRLGAAILALFAEDQVKIFHAAMHGKKTLSLVSNKIAIRDLDAEIRAARRYMASKDFHDVCDMAGVEVGVETAIAHMVRVANIYAGDRKGITVDLARSAWGDDERRDQRQQDKQRARVSI